MTWCNHPNQYRLLGGPLDISRNGARGKTAPLLDNGGYIYYPDAYASTNTVAHRYCTRSCFFFNFGRPAGARDARVRRTWRACRGTWRAPTVRCTAGTTERTSRWQWASYSYCACRAWWPYAWPCTRTWRRGRRCAGAGNSTASTAAEAEAAAAGPESVATRTAVAANISTSTRPRPSPCGSCRNCRRTTRPSCCPSRWTRHRGRRIVAPPRSNGTVARKRKSVCRRHHRRRRRCLNWSPWTAATAAADAEKRRPRRPVYASLTCETRREDGSKVNRRSNTGRFYYLVFLIFFPNLKMCFSTKPVNSQTVFSPQSHGRGRRYGLCSVLGQCMSLIFVDKTDLELLTLKESDVVTCIIWYSKNIQL